MMTRNFLFIGFAAVLTIVGFVGWHYLSQSDELGSKSEWSELQALSSEHSKSLLKENVVIKEDFFGKRYWVLGIAGKNGFPNIWILLNPSYEPYYKQLPEGSYQLDAATLLKALATGEVHPIVAKELASRVTKK
ncbi:hypothetical protein [Sulfuriferula sp.]|uniref:hypothetical protein n=1 Tax=Sulfuriferula sp. TaxID=2025307 RepID=UPI00272FF863|nr:hypothetical protein [Sulfuriferula sp.]MDP2027587.1 hypothetical protein [Sulfuriferula sp.]